MHPAIKKHGPWIATCVACVSGFEGLRTVAYRDPVGIPTICFGETKGVRLGERKTPAQCKAMLIPRLEEFNRGVESCVRVALPDSRRAAFVSFSYNVGVGAFCKSSVARLINQGRTQDACNALLRYDRARGVVLPGLLRRRREERRLCLEGD